MAKVKTINWLFTLERDTNFEDNGIVSFIKRDKWEAEGKEDTNWTKKEKTEIDKVCKQLEFDPEPITQGVYTFDFYATDTIRTKLISRGFKELEIKSDMTAIIEALKESEQDKKAQQQTAPNTNPSDYYFKLVPDPNQDFFLVTPKAYWDANKALLGGEFDIDSVLEANGFEYLTDSTYEFTAGTSQAGHALLVSLGFVENLSL